MSDGIKPDAWMLTGGRLFQTGFEPGLDGATKRVQDRNDGSYLVPLYADWRPQAIAWLEAKFREAANIEALWLSEALEAELRQSKDNP